MNYNTEILSMDTYLLVKLGMKSHKKLNVTKSPLNYIGGKYKLLPQILPLFPKNINRFVDLFTGGCNVGINIEANKVICNDNLIYLIDLYRTIQKNDINHIITHIDSRISEYNLSLTNLEGYNTLRNLYNTNRNHLDLLVLIAYSFNHQIRFNSRHEYNNPFGRERSSFNNTMRENLILFVYKLQNSRIEFRSENFINFDFTELANNDFVYCDPPYLITTGTYNDGKRGFNGWGVQDELQLLNILDSLNSQGINFALSNVLEHKGKSNDILKKWALDNGYFINYLVKSYANSNYQSTNKNNSASLEVLITNYKPKSL